MDFTYIDENNHEIELEYDEDDVIHAATIYFIEYAKRDFNDAVAWLAGRFYDEAMDNAVHILAGSQSSYITNLIEAKTGDPLMIEMAKQAAIDEFNRNL